MIAALYVEKDGAYYGIPDVDPWDEERDARLYAGPWPVVAHPPCERWCQIASLVEAKLGHKDEKYKIGNDGGTFEAALRAVREYGGVLEHPAYSLAWYKYELPVSRVWRLDDDLRRPRLVDRCFATRVRSSLPKANLALCGRLRTT